MVLVFHVWTLQGRIEKDQQTFDDFLLHAQLSGPLSERCIKKLLIKTPARTQLEKAPKALILTSDYPEHKKERPSIFHGHHSGHADLYTTPHNSSSFYFFMSHSQKAYCVTQMPNHQILSSLFGCSHKYTSYAWHLWSLAVTKQSPLKA